MKQLTQWTWLALMLVLAACSPSAPTATPTPIPPTATALPTADAKATETQIAKNIFATQTASVPTATSTPIATPTPTLAPGVLFNDDFGSKQTTLDNGWSIATSSNTDSDRAWAPNQYIMTVNKPDWITYEWPQGTYYNFGAEIEAQPSSPNAEYGIVFRISGSGATRNFYVFGITTEGQCRLRKFVDGQWVKDALVPLTPSAKINPGQAKNKLGVIADASEISLYINGFLVSTIYDDSIKNGSTGLYVLTTDNNRAQVIFSQFTLFIVDRAKTVMGKLQAPLATATPTRTPTPKFTATPLPTNTPPPPAKIQAFMPGIIPCTSWSTNGCQWNYEVIFTEQNGGYATITNIGRRYIDIKGGVWKSSGGEWETQSLGISAHGSNSYKSWVRTTPGSDPDLNNGRVIVSYEGRDVMGNTFSGSVSAKLAAAP